MKINDLYSKRMNNIPLNTESDFENLIATNEKLFYFSLMYCYITDKDLGDMIRFNPILSNAVSLFCITIQDQEIYNYFSKYTDVIEVPEQMMKIYQEYKNNKE